MSEKVLKLAGVQLDRLPDKYTFDGTLDLRGSSIVELPKGLYITEDLYLNEKVVSIPSEVIIGGNIYLATSENIEEVQAPTNKILSWDLSSIVGGRIYSMNGEFCQKPNNKSDYIVLDNGDYFWYKKTKILDRTSKNHDQEPDRVSIIYYTGYSKKNHAVSFQIFSRHYFLPCNDLHEAVFLADYTFALARGLEQYKDLDINTPMLGYDILNLYNIAANPCLSGPQSFLDAMNIKLNEYHTIKEIALKIIEYKNAGNSAPALDVFLKFFHIEEEAN